MSRTYCVYFEGSEKQQCKGVLADCNEFVQEYYGQLMYSIVIMLPFDILS